MNSKRRKVEKPDIKRKEAKKAMPVGALSQEKTKAPKQLFGRLNLVKEKVMEAVQQPAEEVADPLLHDGLSQFERQLIQECREDGMSDSEIRKWMQEI